MTERLTKNEENLIKDILKTIANDSASTLHFANECALTLDEFDMMADSIFNKLQNGRLTVV